MSGLALRAQQLGKSYRIGEREARADTVAGAVLRSLTAPLRNLRRLSASSTRGAAAGHWVWALRDVGFEVRHGEVLGIIGRNGAGKSTLLRILSQITEPTTGRAEVYGRVGSLLEVGTGFHPELTGRENVFLNGSILGMDKPYISRMFDEIVEFSGVGRYIDTPVKRYSSGMYLRLAFAVAAHLEPEILIVDEVLAVGDASFQQKCLGKMEDVAKGGRTVLFVSHNMGAITRLCPRAVLLHEGRLIEDGPAHRVVRRYLDSGLGTTGSRSWTGADRPGNHVVRLDGVRVRSRGGRTIEAVDIRHPVGVEITYEVIGPGHHLVPNFHFNTEEGVVAFIVHDNDPAWRRRPRPAGRYTTTVWVPGNFLGEGTYLVGVALSTHDPEIVHVFERDAVAFQVMDSLDGDSARGDYAGPMPGVVRPLLECVTIYPVEERSRDHGSMIPEST